MTSESYSVFARCLRLNQPKIVVGTQSLELEADRIANFIRRHPKAKKFHVHVPNKDSNVERFMRKAVNLAQQKVLHPQTQNRMDSVRLPIVLQ